MRWLSLVGLVAKKTLKKDVRRLVVALFDMFCNNFQTFSFVFICYLKLFGTSVIFVSVKILNYVEHFK